MKKRACFVVVAAVIAALVPGAASAAIPDNDDYGSAQVIDALPATVSGDVTEATRAADDPNDCWQPRNTMWYSFTPTENVDVQLTLEQSFDAVANVYEGKQGDLQVLSCTDGDWGRFSATAGETYSILVGTYYDSGPGTFELKLEEAPPPPNDVLKTARPINELPFRHRQDVFGAQDDTDDQNCHDGHHTVWFSFTLEKTTTMIVSTRGSRYDTAVGIYTGSVDTLKEVSCNDDTGRSDDVTRRFKAEADKRYLIMVASQNGSGWLDFSLQRALRARLTAQPAGEYHTVTGLARVIGTIRCNQPASVRIAGVLRQRHGHEVTVDDFVHDMKCSRKVKTWRIVVSAGSDAFTAGEAGLTLLATVTVERETVRDKAARLIVLHASDSAWGF